MAAKKKKKTEVYSLGMLSGNKPKTVEMQLTKLGKTKDGLEVKAATDAAGPQVIVIGTKTHLLSKPLSDHATAVKLGQQVVEHGTSIYKDWFDLVKGGVGENLFAIFGAEFR